MDYLHPCYLKQSLLIYGTSFLDGWCGHREHLETLFYADRQLRFQEARSWGLRATSFRAHYGSFIQ